jgi:calpain-15
MAEVPERVYARFVTKERNDAGVYCVTLFVNGHEHPVIIDDYFPVLYGRPAFAKTKDGEMWAMLLEKAWSKLHGSYMRTEGGQTAHAVQHLMGLPAFTIDHDETNANDLFERV